MNKVLRNYLLLLLVVYSTGTRAQNYTRDAGIRLGDYFSATYRQYQGEDQALEGMLFLGRNGMTFTVLKEFFQPAFNLRSPYLYFEYGYGAHVGYRYYNHYVIFNRTYELDKYTFTPLLGIAGYVGLEYRFPEFPFVIGMDAKPYFEFSTTQIFSIYLQSIGISLKYKF
jgi:hypothetical protein